MRAPKQSDSPSGYCRDVYPKRVTQMLAHEDRIRQVERDRAKRRAATMLSTSMIPADDWDGCVD